MMNKNILSFAAGACSMGIAMTIFKVIKKSSNMSVSELADIHNDIERIQKEVKNDIATFESDDTEINELIKN